MRSIAKSFGPTKALRSVGLDVERGHVHALVGENGAGKSTLMKVLAGALLPDAGSMLLDGQPYAPGGPEEARDAGVSMIYQELNLAPRSYRRGGTCSSVWSDRALAGQSAPIKRAKYDGALDTLGRGDVDPRARVRGLGVATQQIVEIARALVTDARIIVFDEPTSSLTAADTRRLFDVIARLREQGVGVIYISHFLEEVQEIADRYTVLREGETVATGVVEGMPLESIIEHMVGRSLEEFFPHVPHKPGDVLLDVSALSGVARPRGVDLQVRRGEIVGIADSSAPDARSC